MNGDNNALDNNIFNLNMSIGFNDTDRMSPSATPIAVDSNPLSSLPTSAPTTKADFCLNTPGWLFGASVKYTCDDDFVWCSDPGARENCCKCKPSCCGYCKTRSHQFDLQQPCHYEPTLRPTSVHMPSSNLQDEYHPPVVTKKEMDETDRSLIVGLAVFAAFVIIVTIMVRINVRQREEIISLRRTMAERRRDPSARSRNSARLSSSSTRANRIRLSFFFDTVLPDMSNANVVSLRSVCDGIEAGENDDQTVTSIQKDDGAHKNNKFRNDLDGSMSSQKRSLRSVFSSWRKQADTGECSICLESYKPGEMICVAKVETCDHVFHKECLIEWLKRKDCCPLCRVNLLVPPIRE